MNSFVNNDDFGDTSIKRRKITRCQCDVEWGTCPGVNNCPYSGIEYSNIEQGEENAEFQSGDEGSR
jgi:hypothetical protein